MEVIFRVVWKFRAFTEKQSSAGFDDAENFSNELPYGDVVHRLDAHYIVEALILEGEPG